MRRRCRPSAKVAAPAKRVGDSAGGLKKDIDAPLKGSTSLSVRSHPKVAPNVTAVAAAQGQENGGVWVRALLEHSFVSYVQGIRFGNRWQHVPRVATAAQAAQIFYGACMTSLVFVTVQIRFESLGYQSSTTEDGDRLPVFVLVGLVSSLFSTGYVIVVHFLFSLANMSEIQALAAGRPSSVHAMTATSTWSWAVVLILFAVCAVCALMVSASVNRSKLFVDVLASWGFSALIELFVLEPIVCLVVGLFNLYIKWMYEVEDIEQEIYEEVEKLESKPAKSFPVKLSTAGKKAEKLGSDFASSIRWRREEAGSKC